MNFRYATGDDLPAIQSLLAASALPAEDFDLERCISVVAEDEGTIVGHGAIELADSAGLLRSVVVDARAGGRGLGARIVEQLENKARRHNVTTLYLLTETAEQYFERRGYVVTDRREAPRAVRATREFSEVCPSTAVFMVKSLR